jgi:hypothetical protein
MKTLVVVLSISMAVAAACGGGGGSASGGSSGSSSDGAFVSSSGDARAEGCLAPADTAGFDGQLILVCGTVVEAVYVAEQGRSTFVYFGASPPGHSFTAVISGSSRSGFNPFPEDQFTPGTNVCIEGKLQLDSEGKPMIDVQSALNMLIIDTLEIHGEHCTGN